MKHTQLKRQRNPYITYKPVSAVREEWFLKITSISWGWRPAEPSPFSMVRRFFFGLMEEALIYRPHMPFSILYSFVFKFLNLVDS